MAIDTPATIVVIGAGPIGLEAALYARFLGYEVHVFERGALADHVRGAAATELEAPFAELCSPLGFAALMAQAPGRQFPTDEARLTAQQWIDEYLEPLAKSDLLAGNIHLNTEVIELRQIAPPHAAAAIEQVEQDDGEAEEGGQEEGGPEEFDEQPVASHFLVAACDHGGQQTHVSAHLVIDAGGALDGGAGPRFLTDAGEAMSPPLVPLSGAERRWATNVPHYYVLGNRSRGAGDPACRFIDGLRQIRDLFGLVGGRASLDLYANLSRLA